jgi:N-acetylmuramoyl-L-alanine amidase
MFQRVQLAAALLLLFLAGCATAPTTRTSGELPPDVDLSPAATALTSQTNIFAPTPSEPISSPATKPAPPVIKPLPPAITLPPQTWIPLARWARANHLGGVTNLQSSVAPTFALTTRAGVFVVRVGSVLAQWSGLEVRLGFAPQLIAGEPCLHRLDLQKNLLPLLQPPPSPGPGPRVIVLDPGHGGKDGGTCSAAGRLEKDYTLDWARRLQTLLEARGWQVFLTRTNDVDVPLAERVAFAEARHADLFLSLHFNATSGNGHAGIETYCLTPTGMPSAITRGYDDDPTLVFPNNQFDAQNLALALRVHRELLTVTKASDRGVRRARFLTVLRGQNRPAVLIEGGYLSNHREAALIDSPDHRQRLAEAIAKAIQ